MSQVLGQRTGLTPHPANAARSRPLFPWWGAAPRTRGEIQKIRDLFPAWGAWCLPRLARPASELGPRSPGHPRPCHLLATGTRADETGNSLPGWGWMAAPSHCSVSAAFWEHLRHLSLQDFPCGLGSWVGSRGGTAVGRGGGSVVCRAVTASPLSLSAEQVPLRCAHELPRRPVEAGDRRGHAAGRGEPRGADGAAARPAQPLGTATGLQPPGPAPAGSSRAGAQARSRFQRLPDPQVPADRWQGGKCSCWCP